MTLAPETFRCSVASRVDGEVLAGTAPSDVEWLFVEYAGAWGRQAVTESRLTDQARDHLDSLRDVRVQLIRRHGGAASTRGAGVRVFTARCGPAGAEVRTALLDDVSQLPDLDRTSDTTAYDGPLWLVCTNGRRDVCCAELGRPVAAALAARWPEATWETTHLGGHRFSGTLLALPSGLMLGRLDPDTAVAACEQLEGGSVPLGLTRGRAGLSAAAQVAELHVRASHPLAAADEVVVEEVAGDLVVVRTPVGPVRLRVETGPGEPRRQSCADLKVKATPVLTVIP